MKNSPSRYVGAASGIVLDQLLGEPPTWAHPVVGFGRIMEKVERANYRDTRTRGLAHAVVGTTLGLGAGALLRATAVATGLCVGGRSLSRAAREVSSALERGDLDAARALLPTLVGRDPSDLGADEVARAAVESVAENTVDAVVAPALFGALAGAPGATAYRAVNTLDAMVGHHSVHYENYGWASARLDDLANWLPARATAALVALVRPRAAREIRLAVATQAPAHPSPNAGVVEAAFAAALGLELGGPTRYGQRSEIRPPLGRGRRAEVSDIERAVSLSHDVRRALVVLLGVAALVAWWRER